MTAPLKPLKWYRELAEKKGRLEYGAFLVEGEKAVRQIAESRPETIIEILSVKEPPPDLLDYPVRRLSESQFDYISRTKTPQGAAAVVELPEGTYDNSLPPDTGNKILLLEDIQDPGNTGTLIRTAAAFGFSGVILTGKCADPFSSKVLQATSGTIMSIWLKATTQYLEVVSSIRKKGYKLITAELEGTEKPDSMPHDKIILALGNEAAGLSTALQELADYRVGIPIAREKAESLNAAVCGGILMYLSTTEK